MSVSISIADIENQRITYPDKNEQSFLSLQEYLKIAERAIKSHCKYHLRRDLLLSEDAISYIAEQIMFADWRWQSNYKGQIVDQKVYRSKCIKWAIKSFLNKSKNKKNIRLRSLNDKERLENNIPSGKITSNEVSKKQIKFLLCNSGLTEPQSKCVRMYYLEQLNFPQIAHKLNISKQAVQQNVQKALENMRLTAGVKNDA